MRRLIALIIMSIIFAGAVSAFETVMTKDQAFRIDLVRVNPSPLQPGKQATLEFELTNLAEEVNDISFSIVEDFPFKSLTPEVRIANIKSGERVSFTFNVDISPDIDAGTYKIRLQYYSQRISATISEAFSISIKQAASVLKTVNFMTIPERLQPGKEAQLRLALQNTASGKIKDISIRLTLENASIPLAPLNGGAERRIKELGVNQEEEVVIDTIVLPNAEVGIYKVPLIIEYYDDLGNKLKLNDIVSIIIDAPVELAVSTEDDNILELDAKGKVSISISNIGLNEVKFLTVTLNERDGYKVVSNNRAYIGNLESDDFDSAEFSIFPNKKTPLGVTISYKDSFNNDYTQEVELNVPMYTKSEASDLDLATGSSIPAILIAIIILASAISIVRKWYHQKSFTKALVLFFVSIILGILELFRLLRPVHLRNKLKEVLREKEKND